MRFFTFAVLLCVGVLSACAVVRDIENPDQDYIEFGHYLLGTYHKSTTVYSNDIVVEEYRNLEPQLYDASGAVLKKLRWQKPKFYKTHVEGSYAKALLILSARLKNPPPPPIISDARAGANFLETRLNGVRTEYSDPYERDMGKPDPLGAWVLETINELRAILPAAKIHKDDF